MHRLLGLTLVISLFCSDCFAEDEIDIFTLDLQQLMQIKVSAPSARDESIHSAPASISVFTAEDIRRLGVTTLHELANLVPGFSSYRLATSSSHYSLVSRGFKTGAASREVLVLWNGIRLNPDSTGGYQFSNRQLSLSNVKRVEFMRGAASSIYGSNAFLGVVNVVTDNQSYVEVSHGSDDQQRLIASANWRLQNGGEHQFFAEMVDDEGQELQTYDAIQNVWQDNRDPFRNHDAYWQFRSESLETNLRWVSRVSTDFYINARSGFEFNRWDSENWLLGAAYKQSLADQLQLTYRFHWSRENISISRTDRQAPLRWSVNHLRTEEPALSLRLDKKVDDQQWFISAEYRRPDLIEAILFPDGSVDFAFPVAEEKPRTILGLASEYRANLNDKFIYLVGGRWDDYSDGHNQFSPRLGLFYTPAENQTVKLLIGDAFRAPTRLEKDPINSPRILGNPNLSAEKSRSIELNYLFQSEDSFFSTTLFNSQVKDLITTAQLPNTNQLWRINEGSARFSGLEIEWQKNWHDRFHSRLVVTHYFETAQSRSPESEQTASLVLSYTIDKFELSSWIEYQGPRDNFSDNFMASYPIGGRSLLNIHLNYNVSESLRFYLQADNLGDKQYVSPSQNNFVPFGVSNRGRELRLGFRIDY